MKPSYLSEQAIQQFISTAYQEDLGEGDHTSLASIPENDDIQAKLLIKSSGVLAGVDLAERIFAYVDENILFKELSSDGDWVKKGDVALIVKGKAQKILAAERLVLNCMQRMSGIATYTRHLQDLISTTNARITDTRKTTPNFRLMEKWAVVIGGGINHRFGLFDQILLKDNHIDIAGGIALAVNRAKEHRDKINKELKIEVETRNLSEVAEALECGVDIIMLDNMDVGTMKKAVDLVDHQCQVEASGGITEETILDVAKSGVDLISVGALTHSYKSLDMSLKVF